MNFGCFAIKKCISVTVIVGPMSRLTAYNIPILVTFWHFNTIGNGFFLSQDSGKLKDQSLWVDFWVSAVNNDTSSSGHENVIGTNWCCNFLQEFWSFNGRCSRHKLRLASEFKLIVLSPTCAALIMQPSVRSDTFLALLGFANILSRTNM